MFYAINITAALYETSRYLLNIILLFSVMVTVMQEGSQVVKLCKALLVVSIVQSGVGILQFYELAFMDIPGSSGPAGLMGNRNLFGSAQVLLAPFVMFVLLQGRKVWKFASIVALSGIVISVVISQTRSAWLAVTAEGAVAFILIIIFDRVNRRRWMVISSAITVSTAIIVTALLLTNSNDSFTKSVKCR
jgi:O-antigen ligase